MNYSKTFFDKELRELTYSDIEKYFRSEKSETNNIEFKAYPKHHSKFNKNIEGVIKSICAFLNSDGGILIWGAPEGQKINGHKEDIFIGELSPLNELNEKDSLINKISNLINPMPIDINVEIIENNNKYIYVFEIQKSQYRPHQYKDKYYARLDGQTRPAPHYLVEALYRRISYPNLEGYIKFDYIDNDAEDILLTITVYIFNFSELQNEEDVSLKITCLPGIFKNSLEQTNNTMYEMGGHHFVNKNIIKTLHYGAPIIHKETIIVNNRDLSNNFNSKLDIFISFGGKKSPLKNSFYKFDTSLINWSNKSSLNQYIQITENKLSSELQELYNMTKEKMLKELLGR